MQNVRLLACARFVRPGAHVCDVGTDHAQLPVYLLEQGIAGEVIASDIGEGPLQSAERTIAQHGLTGRIRTVLSDGLAQVPGEGLTDIVIAGMGGETIVHILADCPFSLAERRLILQPMTKAEILRDWLCRSGFAIREEVCVRDGRFLYAVLCAEYTGIPAVPDAPEIWFGALDLHEENARAYALRQVDKLTRRLEGLHSAGQEDTALAADIAALAKRLEETA